MAFRMSVRILRVCNALGTTWKYGEALTCQNWLANSVAERQVHDTILILEHNPTYTIGKRGASNNFKVSREELLKEGAEIFPVSRGGETTFHGPGQMVVYPIVNLRRLKCGARAYVESLEDIVIDTLSAYGLGARGRVPGMTGVWVGERKIAAIGVQISHGVTRHGAALNVTTDLSHFSSIVPCGIQDKEVTSMQRELGGQHVPLPDVASRFTAAFAAKFAYEHLVDVARHELELEQAHPPVC